MGSNRVNSQSNAIKTHNKRVKIAPFGRWDAQKARALYPSRVCRAWHKTREVKVLLPGIRRAEG